MQGIADVSNYNDGLQVAEGARAGQNRQFDKNTWVLPNPIFDKYYHLIDILKAKWQREN
jgi:hypothetical protein